MEFRKIFDTIPEQFDKYRPRYSDELFASLIEYAEIGEGKTVLELGPGTGQATDPILGTGCDYNAIELGEHLYAKMKGKYGHYPNFNIVNDDFITHNFGNQKFDMIYSAATIQWIPEEIAFSKTFDLLKPGGTLAMMLTKGEYKTSNEELYNKIQKVYSEYFKPDTEYKHGSFKYTNAPNYGYVDFEKREFYGKREFTADEYVAFSGTHCDHIILPEPYKTKFFDGLREAVLEAGNKIVFNDTFVLYLAKKPAERNNMKNNIDFWQAIDKLISSGNIVIDRPKGSAHPRYPEIKYELDYGYIENTASMDGSGIDVWRGSLPEGKCDAIICTVDLWKRDSEIKLLIGCTEEEKAIAYNFHNESEFMKGIMIRR